MIIQRQTINDTVRFEGRGLHSGVPVTVAVHPAERGIRFRLGENSWLATPENVSDTTRCTKLGDISTIEHLMSAFAALEVTDAEVELSAPELPALDGSAAVYFHALKDGGRASIGEREGADVFERIFLQEGDAKVVIAAGSGHWRYEFLTGDRWPGEQVYESHSILRAYEEDLAEARTFGFQEELSAIWAAGLAKGLDSDSALVLGPEGYLNVERFVDEPVRHKLVDAIGDLYLAGIPIKRLNVQASRTGHTSTVKAAKLLWKQFSDNAQASV